MPDCGALLLNGEAARAEAVFRSDLERPPEPSVAFSDF